MVSAEARSSRPIAQAFLMYARSVCLWMMYQHVQVCFESLELYVYSTQPDSQFLSVQASMPYI